MRWWLGLPYIAVAERNLAYLAREHGVALFNPLLDRGFVGSLAALPPAQRFTSRTEAMRSLFGDLLPEAVLTRRSKASFDVIDAPERRRELVERWSGEGVDETYVDVDVLRAEWLRPLSNPSTTPLLQSAWRALGGAETSARDSPELVRHSG
jgi:asparagine synthase (glutamine-hydrolysing)